MKFYNNDKVENYSEQMILLDENNLNQMMLDLMKETQNSKK